MGKELIAAQKADRVLRLLINSIVVIALTIAVVDLVFFQPELNKVQWLQLAGFIVSIAGLSIYLKARYDLGRLFSQKLTISNNHEIVNTGIYRFVRHPVYLGGILLLPSLMLLFNSIFGFVVMLSYVAVILVRIPFEERMLIETLGQQYIEYTKRTSRLIPFIY